MRVRLKVADKVIAGRHCIMWGSLIPGRPDLEVVRLEWRLIINENGHFMMPTSLSNLNATGKPEDCTISFVFGVFWYFCCRHVNYCKTTWSTGSSLTAREAFEPIDTKGALFLWNRGVYHIKIGWPETCLHTECSHDGVLLVLIKRYRLRDWRKRRWALGKLNGSAMSTTQKMDSHSLEGDWGVRDCHHCRCSGTWKVSWIATDVGSTSSKYNNLKFITIYYFIPKSFKSAYRF